MINICKKRAACYTVFVLAVILIVCMLFQTSAYASGMKDFIHAAIVNEPMESVSSAKYVITSEKIYNSQGELHMTWDAELDENGNIVVSKLDVGPLYSDGTGPSISTYTYDELGGIVDCVVKSSTSDTAYNSIVIVDERDGRVTSYYAGETVVLFEYGATGKIQKQTYLYNGYSGFSIVYDVQGLPVVVSYANADEGSLEIIPWAELDWEYNAEGLPSGVIVRNVNTRAEWHYPVDSDIHGNVRAIYDLSGNIAYEFEYELVENPSPFVAAMPPEYVADICVFPGYLPDEKY
ncbi:MAG: hypothetical protein IKE43_10275 [Coriobacteriales bacterium]|nr:hypothetical protein [Coriobacteriales bacterium]